mmetsp:Transcript_28242/g.45712  ORF Transcript_28242/g.45712 Transcript_28242/m.45712 type:complete len:504 (-) Transcript_28242:4549-6060(-)
MSCVLRHPHVDELRATDCNDFVRGEVCRLASDCVFRHLPQARKAVQVCQHWRRTYDCLHGDKCHFQHPLDHRTLAVDSSDTSHISHTIVARPVSSSAITTVLEEPGTKIYVLWDIENCPISATNKRAAFDTVGRLKAFFQRQVPTRSVMAIRCFCDSTKLNKDVALQLYMAQVEILHVPQDKANASDMAIILALTKFRDEVRPPATVCIITGDRDFIPFLAYTRQAGFRVMLIYNTQCRPAMISTCSEAYPWTDFTTSPQSPTMPRPYASDACFPSQDLPYPTSSSMKPLPKTDPVLCLAIGSDSFKPSANSCDVVDQSLSSHASSSSSPFSSVSHHSASLSRNRQFSSTAFTWDNTLTTKVLPSCLCQRHHHGRAKDTLPLQSLGFDLQSPLHNPMANPPIFHQTHLPTSPPPPHPPLHRLVYEPWHDLPALLCPCLVERLPSVTVFALVWVTAARLEKPSSHLETRQWVLDLEGAQGLSFLLLRPLLLLVASLLRSQLEWE